MSARKLIQSFGMAGLLILAGASGAFGQFSIDWHAIDGEICSEDGYLARTIGPQRPQKVAT